MVVDGPVALVTGAGSGIGAATARELGRRGWTVALVARRRRSLEQVAAGLPRAHVVAADLAEPDAPAAVVADALAALGRLDAVVNNAAAFALEPFGGFSREQVDALLATNLRAPFLLVQEALPALRASPAAAVVNVSSAAASMYRPRQALYGLTKAGIEHLTRQLAAELAPDRIRVNCVAPGPIATPFHERAIPDPAEREQRLAGIARAVPLGRLGEPEEAAWWIAALVDPAAAWVTGAVVPVDGGRTLGAPGSA